MQISKALLDWLQETGPDGVRLPKRFGQLLVTAEGRDYGLRHSVDAGKMRFQLRVLAGLDELRRIIQSNRSGEFRPLLFSDDLAPGWFAGPFDVNGLREALDTVYPVAVALWARWRENALPIVSYRSAAARQTGRFKITATLDTPGIERSIAGLCDKVCLRQRLWNIADDSRRLVSDRFGEFPLVCPEPCALLLERARKSAEESYET